MNFKERVNQLKPVTKLDSITVSTDTELLTVIDKNESPGSVRVYANLLNFEDGYISPDKAMEGLMIYREHVPDALANPGKHPSIDLLLDVVEEKKKIFCYVNELYKDI